MLKRMRLLLVASACLCLALFAVACSGGNNASSASSSASASATMGEATDGADQPQAEDAFYALIIGNDSRYGTAMDNGSLTAESPSYSDVIILMRVDPQDYRISLVSVPRDIGIDYNGEYVKLNESYHVGGASALVEQVEKLTGVKISYTFDLGFKEYSEFIDAIGGVMVDIPFDMSMEDAINGTTGYLTGGEGQTLQGADALVFARMRKQYGENQDGCRQYQNRHALQSIISAALSKPSSEAESLVSVLYDVCDSTMPESEAVSLVKDFMDHSDQVTFQLGTYPFDGGINPNTELWQVDYDEGTFLAVTDAIENNTSIQDIVPDPNIYPGDEG